MIFASSIHVFSLCTFKLYGAHNNKCDESPIERADSNATSVPNRQLKLRLAKLCRSTSTICDKMKEFKRKTYAFFMPDNFSHDRFTWAHLFLPTCYPLNYQKCSMHYHIMCIKVYPYILELHLTLCWAWPGLFSLYFGESDGILSCRDW